MRTATFRLFVSFLIIQFGVIMPLAPVWADELNNAESPLSSISLSTPTNTPTLNTIQLELPTSSASSVIVPPNVIDNSSVAIVPSSLPVAPVIAVDIATTSVFTLTPAVTTTIVNISDTSTPAVEVVTSTIVTSFLDATNTSTIVSTPSIEVVSTTLETPTSSFVVEQGNPNLIDPFESFPVVTPANTIDTTTVAVPAEAFEIQDQVTDVASLPDGRKAYRMYIEPRQVEKTTEGKLKLRPKGWQWFSNRPKSQLGNARKPGYAYEVAFDGRTDGIKIKSGTMDFLNGKTVVPATPTFSRNVADNATESLLTNVYPGVDINFLDSKQSRHKKIVMNRIPDGLTENDAVTFWEEMKLGDDDRVYAYDGREITGDMDVTSIGFYVKDSDGNRLNVGTALAYDSSGRPSEFVENPNLFTPTQLVKLDRQHRTLLMGLRLPSSYLLSKERVYPVIVDPTFTGCSENPVNNLTCSTYNFYLRAKDGNADTDASGQPKGICNPAGTCDPNNPANNQMLFVGHNLSSPSHYTRHALIHFDTPFSSASFPFSSSLVQSASLKMFYNSVGLGSGTSGNLKAKKVTAPWSPNNVGAGLSNTYSYSTFRSSLVSNGQAATTVNSTPTLTWYSFDLTNTVKDWINNPATNYGLIVEGDADWSSGNTPPTSWPTRQFLFQAQQYTGNNGPYLEIIAFVAPDITNNVSTINNTTLQAGQSTTVTFKVINQGGAPAGSSVLKYFLNTLQNCRSTSNYVTSGSVNISALANGASASYPITFTVPNGTPADSYCFNYVFDANNSVAEINETNNSSYWAISVPQSTFVDLTRTTHTITPATVKPGDIITADVGIINQGTASAASTNVQFFFNKDAPSYSAGSFANRTLPALGANTQTSVNTSYTVPVGTAPGNYYLSYWINAQGSVNESNITNNQFFVPITVQGTTDLSISNVAIVSQSSLYFWDRNDVITLQARVRNVGIVSTSTATYQVSLRDSNGTLYPFQGVFPAVFTGLGADQIVTFQVYNYANTLPMGGV